MASHFRTALAFDSAAVAVAGGIIAQVHDSSVANAGLYVGAGGLAAALALLVSSFGDKVGPHVVAISRVMADSRSTKVKLSVENARMAKLLQDLVTRIEKAEAVADEREHELIALKARASAVEGMVGDVSRKTRRSTASGHED